jgi:DNA-binding CsgD family transcriptional regulator
MNGNDGSVLGYDKHSAGPPGRRPHDYLLQRDAELAALAAMFAASRHGTGGAVLVSGPPAVGKTALIHAFAEQAVAEGALLVGAACSRSEQALPLGVVRQLFSSAALEPEACGRAKELLDHAALKATLYEPEFGASDQELARVLADLCQILLSLAGDRPLLVAVDDVHDADVPSLQFLLYLVRRAGRSRLMLMLTECGYLLSEHPLFYAEISQQPRFRRLQLGRLSAASVARLFADSTDARTADRYAAEGYVATGGNPLLVRSLIEDCLNHRSPGRKQNGLIFGDAFKQAVLTCMFRSRPAVASLAQAVAILGDSATPEILGKVLDLDTDLVGQAAAMLNAAGLFRDGRFRHPAGRTAVLSRLRLNERAALHARAADALHASGAPIAVVAQHVSQASPATAAPWAMAALREAAEQALGDGDVRTTISYLRLAFRLSTDEGEKAIIESMLALAEWRVNPSWGARRLPRLSKAIRERRLSVRRMAMPIVHLLWHGHADEAADVLESLGSEPVDHEGALQLEFARLCLGFLYPSLLPGLPGDATITGALASAALPYQKAAAILASVLTSGADEEALASIEEVLQAAQLNDATAVAATAMMVALVCADQHERAGYWCRTLLADAATERAPTWRAMFAAIQAVIELRTGNLAAAEACSDQALTCLSAQGWGVAIGAPLASMLLAKTAMGKYDEAAAYLKIPVPDAMFRTPFGMRYLYARGRYFLATKRPHAALSDIRAYGEGMAKWGFSASVFTPWQIDAAQAHLAMGKITQARKLLGDLLARLGADQYLARGRALRVLAASHSVKERLRLLRESVELLQQGGDRFELALAYSELSGAHQMLGEYSQARMVARLGYRLAEQCGDETLRRRLSVDGYPAAGLDGPDMGLRKAVATLSDAQRRVAELAARGYTNRQIAAKLFITVSTVEQHLTSVYRKLKVRSRSELAVTLEPQNAAAGAPYEEEAPAGLPGQPRVAAPAMRLHPAS